MPRIPEEMLHALWKQLHRLPGQLVTTEGLPVEIVHPGQHNHDAGPDFRNAILRIGDIVWAGDVEMHVQASDWNRHGHQTDPAYNAVVLHVVAIHDGEAIRQNGQPVSTLIIPDLEVLSSRYDALLHSQIQPQCGHALAQLEPYVRESWLTRLAFTRFEQKTQRIMLDVDECPLGWEEAFYRAVARSLGLRVNAEPMHALTCATPLKAIYKLRDTPASVEALLFGQAGMLPTDPANAADDYTAELAREYAYQAAKFHLIPPVAITWNHLRLRPSAFPALRIAQLTSLLCSQTHLFSQAMTLSRVDQLIDLFRAQASTYWDAHYRLGDQGHQPKPKRLGAEAARIIILNAVVPFRFAYARARGDLDQQELTIALLEQMPPEANAIVNAFANAGLPVPHALHSQALIQLHREYCEPHRCYYCPAGFDVLTADFRCVREDITL